MNLAHARLFIETQDKAGNPVQSTEVKTIQFSPWNNRVVALICAENIFEFGDENAQVDFYFSMPDQVPHGKEKLEAALTSPFRFTIITNNTQHNVLNDFDKIFDSSTGHDKSLSEINAEDLRRENLRYQRLQNLRARL